MAGLTKAKQALIAKGKCLGDHDAKAYSRGLCQRCLNWARNAIERGDHTEAELIAQGLMLPAKKKGRKPNNALAKALSKKRA